MISDRCCVIRVHHRRYSEVKMPEVLTFLVNTYIKPQPLEVFLSSSIAVLSRLRLEINFNLLKGEKVRADEANLSNSSLKARRWLCCRV